MESVKQGKQLSRVHYRSTGRELQAAKVNTGDKPKVHFADRTLPQTGGRFRHHPRAVREHSKADLNKGPPNPTDHRRTQVQLTATIPHLALSQIPVLTQNPPVSLIQNLHPHQTFQLNLHTHEPLL